MAAGFPTRAADDPRAIRAADFPVDGDWRAKVRFLLAYAVLAPSGHNTQPWLFRFADDGVEVIADRSRALAVVDPHDRELTISCGAAAGTFEIAARAFGLVVTVEPARPQGADGLLALMRIEDGEPPSGEERRLFEAIARRRTDRGAYAPDAPDPATLGRIAGEAARFGVELRPLADAPARERIADLVAEGDRLQFADPHFRRELAAWVHWRRSVTRDGIWAESFGVPAAVAPASRLVVRTFDLGAGIAAGDARKIREGSPVLAVLATGGDGEADWFATGRALARVLLALTAEGLAHSYLNQPIETEALRPRLKEAAGVGGLPQLLLRIGRGTGKPPAPSIRRPVEEVLID